MVRSVVAGCRTRVLDKTLSRLFRDMLTLRSLQSATNDVVRDFRACGLNTEALQDCQVYLVPAGLAFGWCHADGAISIPAVSGSRWWERRWGRRTSLRDVLRHEFGHALANLHPELVEGRSFSAAFGAGYDDRWQRKPTFDEEDYLTPYATKSPAEDFAETVMVHTRHRGGIDRYRHLDGIWRKLEFVRRISIRIRREGIPLA